MFPTTSQILNNYLLPMAVSVFALLLVLGFAVWQLRAARGDAQGSMRPKLFVAVALLAWIAGTTFFNWPIISALRYRIHPEQIVELRVKQLGNESKAPVVISDRTVIANGLKLLLNAVGYSKTQERFLPDGYEIEVKPEGAAEFLPMKLIAYRQSRRPPSGAVQVNVISVSGNSGASAINFSSVHFHSWLNKYVEPQFVKKPVAVAP